MTKNKLNIAIVVLTCSLIACNSTVQDKTAEENSSIAKIEENDNQPEEEKDSLVGLRFNVDEVSKNDSLLDVFSAQKVIANFIGKEVTYFPNSNDTVLKLVPISGNGLINTINICYGQHRPLVLSPDIIWMTIAQGITTHLNIDFNKLENKIFKENKPKVFRVRNDSLEYGAQHWQDLINSLSDSTKKYTQDDIYSFLAPKFSTTTQEIHTAYQANILYGYKKAFTYVGEGGCGIPYITLTGSQSDWVKIKESLIQLDKLGLGYWREELEPVLDEFIAVYNDRNGDKLFWKNIYKEFMDYGNFFISGWIIKFYPYMEISGEGSYDEQTDMMKIGHEFVKNEFLQGEKYLYSTLNIDDFPNYKSEATIIWENHFKDETTKMFLYSGIMGAKQYPDGSLKPWVTWAICSEKEPKSSAIKSESDKIVHRDPNWTPYVYKNDSTVAQKAIYPVKKGIQFDESILEFKKRLSKEVLPNYSENEKLIFYILSNGKPIIITDNKKLEQKVQNWIDKNGIKWLPAKINLSEVMFMSDDVDSSKLITVNSKIEVLM